VHSIRQDPSVVPAQRLSLSLERLEDRLLLSVATAYVDDNFTSGTPGWGVDHFDRIQDGINAASAGGTVTVAEGTYNEHITIGSSKNGLTLQGAGAAATIIDGGGNGTVMSLNNFDGGTISGFTIRNGSANEGAGINADSSDSTVTSCIITGNAADLNGGGVYVNGGSPTFVNDVLTNNTAYFGAAFYMNSASPIFANNTVYNNTASSCGGGLYGADSVFTIANSIFWDNYSFDLFPNHEMMLRSNAYVTIRYSIFMDGSSEIYAWMGADFSYNSTDSSSDPKFVAPGSGDFHLQTTSPAIDAANGSAAPPTDFDGNPRVDDPLTVNKGVGTPTYADIGAFEFGSVISNDPPTVASLQASPDPVTRPGSLTLTALGVDDPNGAGTVAAVEFYRDANGNGTLEPGTDVLVGTDTNGADGWIWTGSTAGWPTGSPHTYFARARDNYSVYSNVVSTTGTVLNAAPTIGSITASVAGGNVTLTAKNVSDDDTVSKVSFYLDQNADGLLQDDSDTYLGDGVKSGTDWKLAVSASGWADGTYTLFARAQDNDSVLSNVVSADAYVGQRYIGRISDPISAAYVDVYAHEDVSLANVTVAFSGGAPSSVQLGGTDPMYGLGLVLHSEPGSLIATSIKDGRKGAVKGDVFFIASDGLIKSVQLKSAMAGYDLNGQTLGGMTFADDIDGDGQTDDLTAIYSEGYVQTITLTGAAAGDIYIGGADSTGTALKSFSIKSAGYNGDLTAIGSVGKVSLGGDLASDMHVVGSLSSLQIKNGDLLGSLDVDGSASKLSISGGDFLGSIDVQGNLSSFSVKGGTTAGGWLRAGSNVQVGGLLGKLSATYHETDNGGDDFGVFAGSFTSIRVAEHTLTQANLPFNEGDFCIELVP